MSLFHTLKFILRHPLNRRRPVMAMWRFIFWQIYSRVNSSPIVYAFTSKSRLLIGKGWTGATGNLYCGLHEFEDMAFLLHFLRPADTFVDIGANIGSYTVLASAEAGALTVAVEPVPHTFQMLRQNVALNNLEGKVSLYNVAVSGQSGSLRFTYSHDTMNHAATDDEFNTIEVPTVTLDQLLIETKPLLIKVDVEGFETEVLQGAVKTLGDQSLQAIIIELNGSGKRYGFDERKVHDQLIAAGFLPYIYHPFQRSLESIRNYGAFNTIYLRDLQIVEKRLATARKIVINGIEF